MILFLDDMQWADAPTLYLVQSIITNTTMKNVLLICAYRDNEVDGAHLFQVLLLYSLILSFAYRVNRS